MTGKKFELGDIKLLLGENVRMKDRDMVESLINTLIDGGKDMLQVITDFDMTLTKQHENGKRCLSSFGIFEVSRHLPMNYKEKALELFHKYYPIEVCHKMSVEEKTPHMIQWYKEAESLLIGCHLTPEDIVDAVQETHTILRDGTNDMMVTLEKAGIPVLVLSAGIGDVVHAVLKKHQVLLPNVSIVSNFLIFSHKDSSVVLDGFKGEFIHVFNKHTAGSGPNKSGHSRSHVILLGDNVGDSGMAEVVEPPPKAVLKIGFLYEKCEERLPSFLEHFDIVLIDDQTMNVMNDLLRLII
ncbi:7-methylguanosine phosphate-specific 5'-nucleotidase [Ischnura elegans]|uniref:7-methylguanosine phosphate-specific 5'-nucleotidase n=1 Tax=Ischnura elegans TaxID=197161 RepID=UPI001ED8A4B4|nr:7-methylguanosine phosphate-specific 5'-nucleotidase [Ischnura elegans]